MMQIDFHGLVANGISALGDKSPETRQIFYRNLREMVVRKFAGRADAHEAELLLEAAISASELNHAPAVTTAAGFVAPDDKPQSAGGWVWAQVIAGCAALGTVTDVLKPAGNLQSVLVLLGILLAVVFTALGRLSPVRRRLLRTGQLLSIGFVVTVAGLFGVGTLFPDGAPNGLVAEVFPSVETLQGALLGIKADTGTIADNTGTLVDQGAEQTVLAGQTADNTGVLVDQGQWLSNFLGQFDTPGQMRQKAIDELGERYTPDVEGLKLAMLAADTTAISQFGMLDIALDLEQMRAVLGTPDKPLETFLSIYNAATSSPDIDIKTGIRTDVEAAKTVMEALSLNGFRDAACKGTPIDVAPWIVGAFTNHCDDETLWAEAATQLIYPLFKLQIVEAGYRAERGEPSTLQQVTDYRGPPRLFLIKASVEDNWIFEVGDRTAVYGLTEPLTLSPECIRTAGCPVDVTYLAGVEYPGIIGVHPRQ